MEKTHTRGDVLTVRAPGGSEEIAMASADMAELARLRTDLEDMTRQRDQALRSAEAEAHKRRTIERVVREWTDDRAHTAEGCPTCAALFALAIGVYPGDK